MFLKFLEFLGRKKTILDRGPSHPEFKNAKPSLADIKSQIGKLKPTKKSKKSRNFEEIF